MSAPSILRRLAAPLAISAALSGCGAAGDADGATSRARAPGTGTVACRFSISQSVRDNQALVDPLAGEVYGAVFLAEDVGATGPRAGAEPAATFEIQLDLTTADPSDVVWTSPDLEPQRYTFLAFFDVDGNGSTSVLPDSGDPVMIPLANQLDLEAGEEAAVTLVFDLLYN